MSINKTDLTEDISTIRKILSDHTTPSGMKTAFEIYLLNEHQWVDLDDPNAALYIVKLKEYSSMSSLLNYMGL